MALLAGEIVAISVRSLGTTCHHAGIPYRNLGYGMYAIPEDCCRKLVRALAKKDHAKLLADRRAHARTLRENLMLCELRERLSVGKPMRQAAVEAEKQRQLVHTYAHLGEALPQAIDDYVSGATAIRQFHALKQTTVARIRSGEYAGRYYPTSIKKLNLVVRIAVAMPFCIDDSMLATCRRASERVGLLKGVNAELGTAYTYEDVRMLRIMPTCVSTHVYMHVWCCQGGFRPGFAKERKRRWDAVQRPEPSRPGAAAQIDRFVNGPQTYCCHVDPFARIPQEVLAYALTFLLDDLMPAIESSRALGLAACVAAGRA